MSTSTNKTTTVHNVIAAIQATGSKLPKPVSDAQALDARLRDAARADLEAKRDLGALWADAHARGENPFADPAFREQIMRRALSDAVDLQAAARAATAERTATAIADSAGAILKSYKLAADAAGTRLSDAHAIIGDLPLSDGAVFVRMGSQALAAYETVRAALKQIVTIETGWRALAQVTGFAPANTEWLDILADTTRDQWVELRGGPSRPRVDAWDLTRAGIRIDLAVDRSTLKARQKRHADDLQQQDRDAEAAWKSRTRSRFGNGTPVVLG